MSGAFTLALAITLTPVALRPRTVPTDLGVSSRAGLVVSSSDIASDIGAAILGAGGNAVDAAVATAKASKPGGQ